jgi:hypothetical protein
LSTTDNRQPQLLVFNDWFGASPLRAFISILVIGVISELKTLYWPNGFISGTFDYLDILAYSSGLLFCYYFDTRKNQTRY